MKKKFFLYLSLFTSVFLIDQISKLWAIKNLINNSINIFPGLNLSLIFNRGIVFGTFNSNSTVLFLIVSSIIILISIFFATYLFWRYKKNFDITPEILVLAGALSNILDRFVHHGVIDFIDTYVKTYHWPTFNLADTFIFVGLFIIFARELKEGFKNES
ncbi:TPA: signal peptidase II [Candidatus Dependentiae bacterium]|nr:MAG: Lipoprotein signal peptidase [candidate division TM6 bacterium GW2011_GWE2_31_21]KKP53713.1 MAG: Lipoprotein signal peptidase [candidate division TM6 bacterium GW2011_GWF2_33_332]HBS48535.1 signal peptidase II [Candidatus Dependentiae bacterium]HBZ73150.1 signal peptidase II [Candidatus Dependentiae bacterium]